MATRRQFGERVGNLADILLRSHLSGQQQDRNQAAQLQRWQMEQAPELMKYMGAHPDEADNIAQLGKGLGLNLDFARPSNEDLLKGVRAGIDKNPYGATEASIVRSVKPLGRGMTTPTVGATERYNTTPEEGNLPSTQVGPTQRPEIQDLLAQATERKTSADADIKRQLGIETDKAFAGAYGKGSGEATATHEAAPTKTQDEVDSLTQTGPIKATNAGLTKGAELDATNTPDRQRAAARGAGLTAGATAAAQSPILLERETALERQRQANRMELEDYKQGHDITGSTRTMMEGAKMVLPHIASLRKQADHLDKMGLFGPVMSRIRQLAEHAGTVEEIEAAIQHDPELQRDRQVGRFATGLGLMASGAARVHGGARGGGAPMMVKYFKGLTSDAGTLGMFNGRMDGVEEYMQGYARGPNAPPVNEPSAPPNPIAESAVSKWNRR